MTHFRFIAILLPLLLAGCMGNGAKSTIDPGQLDVFGIAMYSATDYQEIRGGTGVDEPCIRGYDRSFDALDIVIGYDRKGKIRKITTRNSQNSIFGVYPGETVASAQEKIRGAGFVESGSPYLFRKEDLVMTILANESGKLFGITIETVDRQNQ